MIVTNRSTQAKIVASVSILIVVLIIIARGERGRGAIKAENTIERERTEVDRNLLVGRSLFIFYIYKILSFCI